MKNLNTSILLIMAALGASSYLAGCSGKEVDQGNPQAIYDDAEEDIKDKRYQMAIDKMKTVKNKFPYSHLATLAALRAADVHFLEEDYVASASSYEVFRDLHPKHEKADYVIFRIGESYFNQLPDTADRDMTPGQKAIDAYRELATIYPKSEYLGKAKEHENEASERLASKEKYIADYYYRQDMYDSAAKRYEKITTRFPGTSIDQYAYWKWGASLIAQSELPEFQEKKVTLLTEAKHVYKTYLSRYPSGEYATRAQEQLEGLSQ